METLRNSHVQAGENNAHDNLRPLETIVPLLRQMTGTELPFADVVEQAMICLDKIGNTRRARYSVEACVEDGYAALPAGCDEVEAVFTAGFTSSFASDLEGRPVGPGAAADQVSGFRTERLAPGAVIDVSQYGSRYVDYTFRDGGLYVGRQASVSELVRLAARMGDEIGEIENDAPHYLRVFYRGIIGDERGYPLITPEEALACAYFSQGVEIRKRFFAKEATGDQVQLAQQLSDQHINQARTAPLASSNGLDRMLDEGKRHHRHFVTDDFRVS